MQQNCSVFPQFSQVQKKNLPASTSTYVFDQRNWSVILVIKVILGRDLWSVKNTAALNARVVKGY